MAKKIDEIILGAGELYLLSATDGEIPADNVIETDDNNVGHCSGGASLEYKPDTYDVKNQYNRTVKRFIKGEEISFKFIRGFICKRSMRKPIVIKVLDIVEDVQT